MTFWVASYAGFTATEEAAGSVLLTVTSMAMTELAVTVAGLSAPLSDTVAVDSKGKPDKVPR